MSGRRGPAGPGGPGVRAEGLRRTDGVQSRGQGNPEELAVPGGQVAAGRAKKLWQWVSLAPLRQALATSALAAIVFAVTALPPRSSGLDFTAVAADELSPALARLGVPLGGEGVSVPRQDRHRVALKAVPRSGEEAVLVRWRRPHPRGGARSSRSVPVAEAAPVREAGADAPRGDGVARDGGDVLDRTMSGSGPRPAPSARMGLRNLPPSINGR